MINTFGWVSWVICCNYDNRLENIEEYALSYSSTGLIHSSPSLSEYLEVSNIGLCLILIYIYIYILIEPPPFITSAIFVILLLYLTENSVAAEGFMRTYFWNGLLLPEVFFSVIGYFGPR
jgi:hypothetical protein